MKPNVEIIIKLFCLSGAPIPLIVFFSTDSHGIPVKTINEAINKYAHSCKLHKADWFLSV